MAESQNQKINELLEKLKGLGERVKSTRDQFGQPVGDRLVGRLDKLLTRLPSGNGDSRRPQQPPQPQEPKLVCPKCGKIFLEDVPFCSGCAFSFAEEKRQRQREEFEREKLARGSRMAISS